MLLSVNTNKIAVLVMLCPLLTYCDSGPSRSPADVFTNDPAATDLPANLPPADGAAAITVSSAQFAFDEDTVLTETLRFTPVDGLKFAILERPDNGSLSLEQNGTFVYTPLPNYFGKDQFRVYAWTKSGGSLPATVDVRVRPVGDAPSISGNPPLFAQEGTLYETRFDATEVDGEDYEFSAKNLPDWLILDPRSGALSGTPGSEDIGYHRNIQIRVTDTSGARSTLPSFTLEVLNINAPPTVSLSRIPESLDAREMITVSVFPDDPDEEDLSVTTEPNVYIDVELSGSKMTLTVQDITQVTETRLVVIVTDESGEETRRSIPLTLYPLTKSGKGKTLVGHQEGRGVHIVVLGDGYTKNEMPAFNEHVLGLIALMQDDPSIARHFSALNIHAISTPSVDSGIDDNLVEDTRNTKFDAAYACNGLPRLVCANEMQMFDISLEEYPYLSQLVLLVNDRRFGGSGGSVAIASAFFPEIGLHEMGHSIAMLADEYQDSVISPSPGFEFNEGQFKNVSSLNDPTRVPWAHWIEDENNYPTQLGQPGVGIFEGAFYQPSGLYRGTSDSRMRNNAEHFGPINGEQWILNIYRLAQPVLNFGPTGRTLTLQAGVETTFFVEPQFDESIQKVEWLLDNVPVPDRQDDNELKVMLPVGSHELELKVTDVTGLVQLPSPNFATFNWHWDLVVE